MAELAEAIGATSLEGPASDEACGTATSRWTSRRIRKATRLLDATFPEKRAIGFTRFDGSIRFYAFVNSVIRPQDIVVDLGAGRGAWYDDDLVSFRRELRSLRGKVRLVVRLDPDTAIGQNQSLDAAVLVPTTGQLPLRSGSVDVIVSHSTFEHVDEPASLASEMDRILSDGGWIFAVTPNRRGYIATCARLVPNWAHVLVLKKVHGPTRKAEDRFPHPIPHELACGFTSTVPERPLRALHQLRLSGTWLCGGTTRSVASALGVPPSHATQGAAATVCHDPQAGTDEGGPASAPGLRVIVRAISPMLPSIYPTQLGLSRMIAILVTGAPWDATRGQSWFRTVAFPAISPVVFAAAAWAVYLPAGAFAIGLRDQYLWTPVVLFIATVGLRKPSCTEPIPAHKCTPAAVSAR